MQTEFLCNYDVNELTKYIKNMKKITNGLLILLYIYIISRSNLLFVS
jgi:hypothetical protein